MRKQLRLSGSGGQGGNVTLHPDSAPYPLDIQTISPRRYATLRIARFA